MKIFKGFLLFIVIFFLIFLVVTIFLPSHYRVERKIELKTSSPFVFYLINDLRNWKYWDPWWKLDTTQVRIYEGPIFGKNASFRWLSKNRNIGTGEVKIIEDKPFEFIKLNFLFGRGMSSVSEFRFFNFGDRISLVWSLEGDLKFLAKWFRFFMDEAIGKDFAEGLSKIKSIAEKAESERFVCFRDYFPKVDIIYISDSTASSRMEFLQKFNETLLELLEFSKEKNLQLLGNPIAIYNGKSKNTISFDVCIPVVLADSIEVSGRIQKGTIPSFNVLRCVALGNINDFDYLNSKIQNYLIKNGLSAKWKLFEMFYTDPLKTNPKDNLSIIYCPL